MSGLNVWAENAGLKEQWKKSFVAEWDDQRVEERTRLIHFKQPNHIVLDIRK